MALQIKFSNKTVSMYYNTYSRQRKDRGLRLMNGTHNTSLDFCVYLLRSTHSYTYTSNDTANFQNPKNIFLMQVCQSNCVNGGETFRIVVNISRLCLVILRALHI